MALNFPDAPTLNQVFDKYTWDGEKWISTIGGIPLVLTLLPPLDGLTDVTGAWSAGRKLLTSYSANGGAFYENIAGEANTWYEQSFGSSRNWNALSTATRPNLVTSGPNSRAALDFDGVVAHDVMTNAALSNFMTASNGYVIASFNTDSVASNDSLIYNNSPIFTDAGQVTGLFIKLNTIYATNWDGSQDTTAGQAVAINTTYVVEWWHTGGNLNLRLNGGTVQTVASGNSSPITGAMRMGRGIAGNYFDGRLFEMIIFNIVPVSGVRDALMLDLKTYYGA